MRTIGLTGGIGAGKDAVAEFLRRRGAAIIDADEISHSLLVPGHPALELLVQEFGPRVFLADGAIDRVRLARLIFSIPESRRRLNKITHPAIIAEAFRRLEQLRASPVPPAIAIVVAPLFFEAHMESMVEKIIVVVADDETRLHRLQARDGLNETEIRARFAAQLSPEVQKQRAHWVIDNSGSLEETERQVEKIWKELQGE